MEQLPQQLINGIWQGAVLALFALGYTLVFGVLDIVNLAHGATFMWGAFTAFLLVTRWQWPLWAAIPAAMIAAGLLAVVLDRVAFKPLRALTSGSVVLWVGFVVTILGLIGPWSGLAQQLAVGGGLALLVVGMVIDFRAMRPLRQGPVPRLAPMISSIGASIVFISVALGLFGAQVSRFPPTIFSNTPYQLLPNAVIAPVQLLVLVLAVGLMGALNLLIERTQLGRSIRAIAWNERTARLLGINVDRAIALTFFISGALAGAAWVLLGLAFNRLEPTMGNEVELAGLTVIILGGMGNIRGTVLAAFLVGMMRVLSVAYLDSSFRDAFVYALLILVLLVRPYGIFGRSGSVRT